MKTTLVNWACFVLVAIVGLYVSGALLYYAAWWIHGFFTGVGE